MSKSAKTIRPKERDTIIQALSAGVVPRLGLAHIQVGRAAEIAAMLRKMIDLGIADVAGRVRFIIGEYGASDLFAASQPTALERKCVTMHADLSPNRRIHASGGQARALYSEAVNNMATRNKPEGGALQSVIERLVTDAAKEGGEKRCRLRCVIDEK